MAKSIAIKSAQRWVERVVVGLNFCPFAKREVMRNSIRYVEYSQRKLNPLITLLSDEISHLQRHPDVETTLIVLSAGFKQFWDYLDAVDRADIWLDNNQFRGKYQIASFHPQYCFAGEEYDACSNFTNRSPYPILHLLREASIENAISRYKQPESIPADNIVRAKALGKDALQALITSCMEN